MKQTIQKLGGKIKKGNETKDEIVCRKFLEKKNKKRRL